jgi:hypothetical protein
MSAAKYINYMAIVNSMKAEMVADATQRQARRKGLWGEIYQQHTQKAV